MLKVVGVVALVLVFVTSANAAKPKPWSWTTSSAVIALEGTNPSLWVDQGTIDVTKCAGKGKAVLKRYVSFACAGTFKPKSLSGTPAKATLYVRVRPVGKGQVCASLKSLAAVPKACLNPSGVRTSNSINDARVALGKYVGEQLQQDFPYQGPTGCFGYGAGYFECWFGASDPTDPNNGQAVVIMSTKPVVTITKMVNSA